MRNVEAVIFDWAGTTVDYGCFAPVQAFVEVFKHFGIEPTMQEVREPMGMLKIDHIRTMLHMPRIQKLWEEKYGQASTEEDVEKLYGLFEEKLNEHSGQVCTAKAICSGSGKRAACPWNQDWFYNRIYG